jgi:hypothetical protein
MYIVTLRRLRDAVRGKRLKNGEPRVGFNFTIMLQHTGHFGQRFISKEQCDNNAAAAIIPWPGSS